MCILLVLVSAAARVADAQRSFVCNKTDGVLLEGLPVNETQLLDLPFNETTVEQLSQGRDSGRDG